MLVCLARCRDAFQGALLVKCDDKGPNNRFDSCSHIFFPAALRGGRFLIPQITVLSRAV